MKFGKIICYNSKFGAEASAGLEAFRPNMATSDSGSCECRGVC